MAGKEKKEKVKQIRKWFEGTDSLLILRYKGLRVAEANELRGLLKGLGADLHVLKNTLTRIALEGTDKEPLAPFIDGPVAVVLAPEDPAPAAREVKNFAKGRPEFGLRGGLFKGRLLQAEEMESLAGLPPREVLVRRMVGQTAAPLSGLVGVCAGLVRNLLGVMRAVAGLKEEETPEEKASDREAAGEEAPEEKPPAREAAGEPSASGEEQAPEEAGGEAPGTEAGGDDGEKT